MVVDQAGTDTFELRRWPRESELKLTDALPATKVTDGTYVAGKSLPIAAARLTIAGIALDLQQDDSQSSFVAERELKEGPTELQTTFLDANGTEICGAYYVYVRRK